MRVVLLSALFLMVSCKAKQVRWFCEKTMPSGFVFKMNFKYPKGEIPKMLVEGEPMDCKSRVGF